MVENLKNHEEEPLPEQLVVIFMGSGSDEEHCGKITNILDDLEVKYDRHVASAHKTPDVLHEKVRAYVEIQEGHQFVFITIAGLSNALSGHVKGLVYDANPPIRVIASPPFNEIDIWASLRMPKGVVVPAFLDPQNAALDAVETLAYTNPDLAARYVAYLEREYQQPVHKADDKYDDLNHLKI